VDATAIILTGGKSSRMGRPKALLPFGGEPLIAHTVRALRPLFAHMVVVAAPDQELPFLPATVVRDELPFQGPVGGIYYGLKVASGDFAFVTSCDLPFLNLPLIAFLTEQISNYDVVVPYWQERFQPLHAVYRKTVAPFLKEQLERSELRPIFLYKKVRTLEVSAEEIRRFDPEGLSFLNMNSPADYETAVARWQQNQSREPETAPFRAVSVTNCTVELFGVARLLTKTREVALSLPPKAALSDVYMALADKHPILLGRVIAPDGRSLTGGYASNLNGLDFVRSGEVKITSGDRVFIISADAGG
jgi:molybdopterin-guanine dinucleotide biosynthesis protein A